MLICCTAEFCRRTAAVLPWTGDYEEGPCVTHVNILHTLEVMYQLHPSGAQQPNAAAAGISDTKIITDFFTSR